MLSQSINNNNNINIINNIVQGSYKCPKRVAFISDATI